MYECSKEGCSCTVSQKNTYCSDDCVNGLPCGCEGCDCGSEES